MTLEESEMLLQPFLDKMYRKSKSEKTGDSYFHGTLVFCRWYGKDPGKVIADLKQESVDVYKVLDDYVTYLSKSGRAPNTIKGYLTIAKKFLRAYGIEFSNDKLKEMIDMPRTHGITQDRIPTIEEMKAIIYSTNVRGKAMIAMLVSSGMRIGELLSLRVKDIDFGTQPTTVRLRAEVTKDRLARICFISDEATKFLKQYLGERVDNPDSYIFQGRHQGVRSDGSKYQNGKFENRAISYWNADTIFTVALKRAGIYEKDDHGRDRIHLHVMRKFFFTQMVPILGREITEALMGHKAFYDSAYRRFTESQLGEYYLKGMHAVTIIDSKQSIKPTDVQTEVLKTLIRQQGLDPDDLLTKKRVELGRELIPEERIDLLSKILINGNGSIHEDEVIDLDELEPYIDDGWHYVDELSNGKVIVRRSLA